MPSERLCYSCAKMLFSLIEETHQHAGSDVELLLLLLCNFFSLFSSPSFFFFFLREQREPAVSPYPESSFEKSESNEIIAARAPERKERDERRRKEMPFLLLINVFRAVSSRAERCASCN
jgi:hypothetical protein